MCKKKIGIAVVCLWVGCITPALATTCLLEVDGQRYIDGDCESRVTGNGNLDIRVSGGASTSYSAFVWVRDGNTGRAVWNGKSADRIEPLGAMMREGSCWKNAHAKICAW